MQTDGNVIILGDFNTPDIDWHALTADFNFSIQLCNLIFQYNYSQVVTSPTHEHGNLLDLVLTNNEDIISDVQVHSEGTFIKSDHYLVSFKLKSILNHKPDSCPITILDYSKANYDGLNQFLSSIDYSTCYQSENVEFVWSFVKSLLLQGIRRFIPTIKLKTTAHPKWFTPALRHQLKCIQTLKRRYHKSPTEHIKSRILLSENQVALESSLAKSSFESYLINHFVTGNQTKIFQYIRSITKSHSIPSTIFHNDSSASNDNDKATIFHSVFSTNTTSSSLDVNTLDPCVNNHMVTITISEGDVYNALSSLNTNKAFGIDGIGPKILNHCAISLFKPLHYLFSLCLRKHNLPHDWLIRTYYCSCIQVW